MTIRTLLWISAVAFLGIWSPVSNGYCAEPPRAHITEIKAHPSRYDGRVVEVHGILGSGHLGVFLGNGASSDLIRLRMETAGSTSSEQVVRDALFDRLRELAAQAELPGVTEHKFEVRLVGRVRLLKGGGKPRKRYYPQIESLIEVTPIRVLSIRKADVAR